MLTPNWLQFGFTFLVAYSANAVAFWQGSREITRAADGQSPNITAGAVYTVIFVLLDGTSNYTSVGFVLLIIYSVFCHQPSSTFPSDIRRRCSSRSDAFVGSRA